MLKVGNCGGAHRSILRDLRDETESEILLRSLTEIAPLPEVAFSPDQLGEVKPTFEVAVPEVRFVPISKNRPVGAH